MDCETRDATDTASPTLHPSTKQLKEGGSWRRPCSPEGVDKHGHVQVWRRGPSGPFRQTMYGVHTSQSTIRAAGLASIRPPPHQSVPIANTMAPFSFPFQSWLALLEAYYPTLASFNLLHWQLAKTHIYHWLSTTT